MLIHTGTAGAIPWGICTGLSFNPGWTGSTRYDGEPHSPHSRPRHTDWPSDHTTNGALWVCFSAHDLLQFLRTIDRPRSRLTAGQSARGAHLSKMAFFQSTAFVLGLGLGAIFFLSAVGSDAVAGCVGVGTIADAGFAAIMPGVATTEDELDLAATPATPSPTTTNGAQYAGWASFSASIASRLRQRCFSLPSHHPRSSSQRRAAASVSAPGAIRMADPAQ